MPGVGSDAASRWLGLQSPCLQLSGGRDRVKENEKTQTICAAQVNIAPHTGGRDNEAGKIGV